MATEVPTARALANTPWKFVAPEHGKAESDLVMRAANWLRKNPPGVIRCREAAFYGEDGGYDEYLNDLKKLKKFNKLRPPFNECWFELGKDESQMGFAVYTITSENSDGGYTVKCKQFACLIDKQLPERMSSARTFDLVFDNNGQLIVESERTACLFLLRALSWLSSPTVILRPRDHHEEPPLNEPPTAKNEWVVKWSVIRVQQRGVVTRLDGLPVGDPRPPCARTLVRGYWSDYTKGEGLFGKYKCMVWKPPHLKGDPSRGVILREGIELKPSPSAVPA